ncbi:MAG TPA: ABC transporter permease [Solirubrobacteraceae bacterium]|jgi:rhamnose transport system permease protein|nr:ABC transporter permease [Solirubrobacteraceae bacterium]
MSDERRGDARSRMKALLRQNETGLFGIVLLVTVIAAITVPAFRGSGNPSEILDNASLVIIVAVGEYLVIVTRQIDLSTAATLGLSAYLIGSLVGHIGFAGPVVGIAAALALGTVLGLFNGVLVERVKMPAIIATLATLSIYSGLQVVVTHGTQLYQSQLPNWLGNIISTSWLGLSPIVWAAIAVTVVVTFVGRMTSWGRDIYAMGSNPEAAHYLGIRTSRRTYEVFAGCGALAGLAGLMYAGQYGNVDATAGNGFELTAIAAAVIGGVSLFGGSGSALGAALGALLLTEIENILALLKISIFAEQTLEGSAIVIAVAAYALLSRRLSRPARRSLTAQPDLGASEAFTDAASTPQELST